MAEEVKEQDANVPPPIVAPDPREGIAAFAELTKPEELALLRVGRIRTYLSDKGFSFNAAAASSAVCLVFYTQYYETVRKAARGAVDPQAKLMDAAAAEDRLRTTLIESEVPRERINSLLDAERPRPEHKRRAPDGGFQFPDRMPAPPQRRVSFRDEADRARMMDQFRGRAIDDAGREIPGIGFEMDYQPINHSFENVCTSLPFFPLVLSRSLQRKILPFSDFHTRIFLGFTPNLRALRFFGFFTAFAVSQTPVIWVTHYLKSR